MSHYDIHVGDVIKYPEMVMTQTYPFFFFVRSQPQMLEI